MLRSILTLLFASLMTSVAFAKNYNYKIIVNNKTSNIPITVRDDHNQPVLSPTVIQAGSNQVTFNINDDGSSFQVWFRDNHGINKRTCFYSGGYNPFNVASILDFGGRNSFEVNLSGGFEPGGYRINCSVA